jgi:hypothetical protein
MTQNNPINKEIKIVKIQLIVSNLHLHLSFMKYKIMPSQFDHK